jgi:hypothetical protein
MERDKIVFMYTKSKAVKMNGFEDRLPEACRRSQDKHRRRNI